jgi:hypothetical protein
MKNLRNELVSDIQEMSTSNEREVCCICGKVINGYGNNPSPYMNRGRCCDQCNRDYVIKSRLLSSQLRNFGLSKRKTNLAIRKYRQITQAKMNQSQPKAKKSFAVNGIRTERRYST